MEPTSTNSAGNVTEPAALLTLMTPSSSGWRRASSTTGENSPNSSRNRTPPWAALISPGRSARDPPPTRATIVVLWCGARNGGAEMSALVGTPKSPAE